MSTRGTPPAAPTSMPLVNGNTFDVAPMRVRDLATWVCRYVTTDERIHPEFRAWQAVWVDGAWEVDEV